MVIFVDMLKFDAHFQKFSLILPDSFYKQQIIQQ